MQTKEKKNKSEGASFVPFLCLKKVSPLFIWGFFFTIVERKKTMNRYYQNRLIKKCVECPFCEEQIGNFDGNEFKELYCVPIKAKYGCNLVDEKSLPNASYCRLNNEVTEEFIFPYGSFFGKSISEVKKIAPKYIKYLLEKKVFVIVSRLSEV